jgi:putative addiction module component (TIGR02574 family)
MNTIEIKKMSMIERLQTMEALWDSFLDEESEIESPEWHRDIIEERKRKIKNGKAEFFSLEELKASRQRLTALSSQNG